MEVRGNGSIVAMEDKPRYKCRKWRLYVSTDSGQKTRVVHGTLSEARRALESFKKELAAKIPNNQAFAAYAASWLSWREMSGELAPGTIANNRREVNALLRTGLADMRLDEIAPEHCREALMWLKTHPARARVLSNTTMNKLYLTLSQIFAQAVDDERINRNPMAKIKPPKPDTKEKRALAPDELMRFVHSLDSLPLDGRVMALYLMALLGLRRAEACALKDSDIRSGFAHIHLAIKERNGTIGEPKSPASIRTIPCPEVLLAKVDEWRDMRAMKGWQESETLCCNTHGGVIRPQLLQRWWTYTASPKLGLEGFTLHQLRHSNLSMMARHLSPFDLQRYAGWSSIEPARVYIHDDLSTIQRAISDIYGQSACTSLARKDNRPQDLPCDLR